MVFLIVLLGMFASTWLIPPTARWTQRSRWRVALALGMAVAGLAHLVTPAPFLQHLPPWMPLRSPVVVASGLIEMALGAALLVRASWRHAVGVVLAIYLIAVFPGNIYVAWAGVDVQGQPDGIYPWVRLLFQPLFIWLALWTTKNPAAHPSRREARDVAVGAGRL